MKRISSLVVILFAAACGGGGGGNRPFFTDDGGAAGDLAGQLPADMTGMPAADLTMQGTPDLTMQAMVDMAMATPACDDGIKNGAETDTDCGGFQCGPCADTKGCKQNSDCNSLACSNGKCAPVMMQKKPVGSTCAISADCSGLSAKCYNPIPQYNWSAPGGYCSNSGCANDNDCGNNGFCDGDSSLCFAKCAAKGQCQAVNANNRCFNFDNAHSACLPSSVSKCNPTDANEACACNRLGLDDVGHCMTKCTLNGGQCANGMQCLYLNAQYDLNGKSTGDVFAGLVCLNLPAQPIFPNGACTHIDNCTQNYECDIYGIKQCKQICQKGVTQCLSGTCQNAFKVNGFGVNSYGLCLL
ncbi:MAG: hypothetical protein EXR72_06920 [Myxococcales bacterium]|nr:hypothetical protein [Myxococcales bacterium]